MIIVLIGPHGAGKTTLGQALAARLGLPFHPELGRELAEDPAWRPAGVTAEDRAEAFDRELFARELARDLAHGAASRVVETWHPGNLAYAARRSPAQAAGWLSALRAACAAVPAVAVPVHAAPAVLAARQSEPGDLAYFRRVGTAASAWAQALGLLLLPAVDTSAAAPAELAEAVVPSLARPFSFPPTPGA